MDTISMVAIFAVCGLLSYLLGAIPCGYIIAYINSIDIRTVGSGNIGATNVFRAVGKGWGIFAFFCDALKGFIAAVIFPLLSEYFFSYHGGTALQVICGTLAVVGHNWPVYLRFKGGKGVATSAGALIGIAPKSAGVGLLVWILVFCLTRYVSVASILAAAAVMASAWFFYLKTGLLVPAVLTCLGVLAILRHKDNIRRLLKGTENRFHFRKK